MPRLITVDFTHEIIGRDYMVQTLLDGIPATEHLRTYPRSTWPTYYRQLGEIARRVHAVRGPCFGPLAGPAYGTWSDAVAASLEDIAADLEGAGLDAGDVRKVVAAALRHRTVLDEITEPRLLGGDLWIPNTLLDHDAAEPTINGVYDFDRTWWGDPAADWTIRMVTAKADERTTFWDTYGPLDQSESAQWRQKVYEARHLGAIRLERHRLGNREECVPATAPLRTFSPSSAEAPLSAVSRKRRERSCTLKPMSTTELSANVVKKLRTYLRQGEERMEAVNASLRRLGVPSLDPRELDSQNLLP